MNERDRLKNLKTKIFSVFMAIAIFIAILGTTSNAEDTTESSVEEFVEDTTSTVITQSILATTEDNWFILQDNNGIKRLYVGEEGFDYMCVHDVDITNQVVRIFMAKEGENGSIAATGGFRGYMLVDNQWQSVGYSTGYLDFAFCNYNIIAKSKEFTPCVNGTLIKSFPGDFAETPMVNRNTTNYILSYHDSKITFWLAPKDEGCWVTTQNNYNFYWLDSYDATTYYSLLKFTYNPTNDSWTYEGTSDRAYGWPYDVYGVVGASYKNTGEMSRIDIRGFFQNSMEIPFMQQMDTAGDNWFILEDTNGYRSLYVGEEGYEYMCLQDVDTNNNLIKVFLANDNSSITGEFAWYLEMGGYWFLVGNSGEYINLTTNNYKLVGKSKPFTPYVNGTVVKSLPTTINKDTSSYVLSYHDAKIYAWVAPKNDGCWVTLQNNYNFYWLDNYSATAYYPVLKYSYDVTTNTWTDEGTSSRAFGWPYDVACVIGPSYTPEGVISRLDVREFFVENSIVPDTTQSETIGDNWFILEDEVGGRTLYIGEAGYDNMIVRYHGDVIKVSTIKNGTNEIGKFLTYKSNGEKWTYSGKTDGIITYYNTNCSLVAKSKPFVYYYNDTLITSLPAVGEGSVAINPDDTNSSYIITNYNNQINLWNRGDAAGMWVTPQTNAYYMWMNSYTNITNVYPIYHWIYDATTQTWTAGTETRYTLGSASEICSIVGPSYTDPAGVSRSDLRNYFKEVNTEYDSLDVNQYLQNEKLKLDETKWSQEGVNPVSGDFGKTYIDFEIGNSDFNLSRTYNSLNAKSSILGTGWRFNIDASIEAYANAANTYIIYLPDGSIDVFTEQSNGTLELGNSRNSITFENDKYIYKNKNQIVYEYNGTSKKLEKIIDEFGNEIQITRDENNKITKVTDYVQNEYTFEYNTEGTRLTKITDPIGRTVEYIYTNDLLTTVKNADGTQYIYEYNADNKLIEIKQQDISTITTSINKMEYVSTGLHADKILKLTTETGNVGTYKYDNYLRVTTETDSNQKERKMYYDSQGAITKIVEANGAESIITYSQEDGVNKYSEATSTQDIYGNVTSYERDSAGNVTKQINPDNSTKQYWYNEKNNVIKEIDEVGNTTEYIYDTDGITLLKIVKPLDGVKAYDVNEDQTLYEITNYTYYTADNLSGVKGLVHTITNEEGTITYEYDQYGNISKETDSAGNVTVYSNYIIGWRVSEQVNDGYVTTYEYSGLGEITKATKNNQVIQQTTYRYPNQPTSITDGNGNIELKEYNANGNVTKHTDREGNVTTYGYDLYGNVSIETKPNGAIYKYEYDELNRLTKISYKADETSEYTVLESKTYSVENGNSIVTTKTYIDATEYKTKIETFDYNENLIREENDGRVKTITYLANGLKASETAENGATTYYYYNGANNLKSVYTQIDTHYAYTEYEYDNLGRVVKEKLGNEKVELGQLPTTYRETVYEYNSIGKITKQTTTAGEEIIYEYDMYGNVTLEKTKVKENEYSITQYEYNYLNKPTKKIVNGRTTVYEYDGNGNVVKETSPENIETTYTYNKNSQLTQTSIANNVVEKITYDNMGNVATKVDGNNNTTTYEYDKLGNVIKETNALNGVTTYQYDLIGRVVETKNPKNQNTNNKIVYKYDKFDNVIEKDVIYIQDEETKEIVTKWEYDASNNITKVIEPNNIQTLYEYNKANKVTKETNANGKETTYEYDAFLNTTKVTNANGVITLYTYDSRNNMLTESVKPNAEATAITIETNEYDLLNNNTKKIDAMENATVYEYNLNSELTKETKANSYIETYTYNNNGQVIKFADNLNYEKIYEYDVFGNITLEKEQKNDATQVITITREYDLNGNKTKEIDGKGNITTYEYNALNKLVKETNAKNQITTYEYDANGNMTKETNFAGNSKIYVYDALDRLVETKNELGQTIEKLEYDDNNRQTKSIDALGKTIQYVYDNVGNILQEIDQENNAVIYTYDAVNNKISTKDKKEKTTTFEYDYANNLIKVTNPLNQVTQYEYDKNNNLVKVTDAKNQTKEYTYDNMNNELTEKDALGNIEQKTYTLDGLQATLTTRNGDAFSYEYDVFGRLISETVNNATITYSYDNNDNLVSITNGDNITTNTYDELNRITQKQENGLTISYTYDIVNTETGSISEKVTDPKGNEVTKEYDKAGRLVKVQNGTDITQYEYNEDGTTKKVTYSNGATEEYQYNADKTLLKLINTNGTEVDEYIYEYDENNNITKKTDPKGITIYFYDDENKLTMVQTPSRTTIYEYDAVGNRTKETIGTVVKEYAYNAKNQLTSIIQKENDVQTKETTYTYDNNGNQLEERENNVVTQSYEYNVRNELVELTKGEATTTYTYNAEGLRTAKQSGTDVTKFVYDGTEVILELDGSNNEKAQNVYGLALVSREVGEQKGYYLYNGHGDVEEIISSTGESLNTYYYDEYGNIEEKTETMDNPYRYAGYFYDVESDNYYLQNRYYNPALGIFISEDTYRGEQEDPLSLNRYVYVKQNPMKYIDPSGNVPIIAPIISGGLTAAFNWFVVYSIDQANGDEINFEDRVYLGAAIEGFIVGFTYKIAGGAKALKGLFNFLARLLGTAANDLISTGEIDLFNLAFSSISKGGKNTTRGISKVNAKNIISDQKPSNVVNKKIAQPTKQTIKQEAKQTSFAQTGAKLTTPKVQKVTTNNITNTANTTTTKATAKSNATDQAAKNKKDGKTKDNIRVTKETKFMTTKEATEAAKKLGFVKTNYILKDQRIFKKGNKYIVQDIDKHSGGTWKMATSVEKLADKKTRLGTYDVNLNRIGD